MPREGQMELFQQVQVIVSRSIASNLTVNEVTDEVRRQYFIELLLANNFNQCRVARETGLHRNTLARQLAALGVDQRALRAQYGIHGRRAAGRVTPPAAAQQGRTA